MLPSGLSAVHEELKQLSFTLFPFLSAGRSSKKQRRQFCQGRLDWAREPEIAAKHLSSYSVEAPGHVPAQIENRGYHNFPFDDPQLCTCFRIMIPDLPEREDVFAYAVAGSVREQEMKAVVLSTPDYRQHMTLTIESHAPAGGKRLFEITRALAVGWVRGNKDIESVWEAR